MREKDLKTLRGTSFGKKVILVVPFVFWGGVAWAAVGNLAVRANGRVLFLKGILDLAWIGVDILLFSLVVSAFQYFLNEANEGYRQNVRRNVLYVFLGLIMTLAVLILANTLIFTAVN